jgi:uncharacterized integral membrane protein
MTDAGPTPSARPTAATTTGVPPQTAATPVEPTATTSAPSAPAPSGRPASNEGLGHTRTSGIWAAVVALVVLLVLLAVFVLQNVQQVEVSYFGWEGRAPLASALLIATASGALIAVIAGTLRILQLRRRVRRAQKH